MLDVVQVCSPKRLHDPTFVVKIAIQMHDIVLERMSDRVDGP